MHRGLHIRLARLRVDGAPVAALHALLSPLPTSQHCAASPFPLPPSGAARGRPGRSGSSFTPRSNKEGLSFFDPLLLPLQVYEVRNGSRQFRCWVRIPQALEVVRERVPDFRDPLTSEEVAHERPAGIGQSGGGGRRRRLDCSPGRGRKRVVVVAGRWRFGTLLDGVAPASQIQEVEEERLLWHATCSKDTGVAVWREE